VLHPWGTGKELTTDNGMSQLSVLISFLCSVLWRSFMCSYKKQLPTTIIGRIKQFYSTSTHICAILRYAPVTHDYITQVW
jgi:hypothetical protein